MQTMGVGHWLVLITSCLMLAAAVGCVNSPPHRTPQGVTPVSTTVLQAVYQIREGLYSGNAPETAAAFADLEHLRIKTIISVDGAQPHVELARAIDARYVHLPLGYTGISASQRLTLCRAVNALPKPIYIHCHKGRHRGPAAAGVAVIGVYGWSSARAADALRAIGTSPRYSGLYRSVTEMAPLPSVALSGHDFVFPEVAETPPLTLAMATASRVEARLELARKSGWQTPPDHPDIDPAHEALQLKEIFRELARNLKPDSAGFVDALSAIDSAAADLEASIRAGRQTRANAKFAKIQEDCTACHTRFRDE
jgi:hypothetical protein